MRSAAVAVNDAQRMRVLVDVAVLVSVLMIVMVAMVVAVFLIDVRMRVSIMPRQSECRLSGM
jgi:hypothetical protein